jgi:PleD family two-component response regulator
MMNNEKVDAKRIVIFDDSVDALKRFEKKFEGVKVEIQTFRTPFVDEDVLRKLIKFKPQLIVVDLILEGFKEDGYGLIKDLQEIEDVKDIPIIVCSKLINPSDLGLAEKEECLKLPGVVAAYPKFPGYPSAEEFLKYIPKD